MTAKERFLNHLIANERKNARIALIMLDAVTTGDTQFLKNYTIQTLPKLGG